MEDPAVITALNHSGCFGRNLVQFKEKNKDVIHQSKSVRIGKKYLLLFVWNVPTVLSSARGRGLANNIYLFDATSATPKPT